MSTFVGCVSTLKGGAYTESSFGELLTYFELYIKKAAASWARNVKICKLHTFEDLANIFKGKLLDVVGSFIVDANKSDLENERIFAGFLKVSIRNAAIDLEYKEARSTRMPSGRLISITNSGPDEEHETQIAVNDKDGEYTQLIESIRYQLNGDVLKCFNLKLRGHKDKNISILTGIKRPKVREMLNGPVRLAIEYAAR